MALGDRLGGAYVEISADAQKFYKTLDSLDAKSAKEGKEAARSFLRTLEAHLKASDPEASIGLDTSEARAAYERFAKSIDDLDVDLDINSSRFKDIKIKATAVVDKIINDESIAKIKAEVTERSKDAANDDLDDIAETRTSELKAETNAVSNRATSAVLTWLSRPRTVEFYAQLKQQSVAKVATALAALSGGRMLKEQTQHVIDMVKNLDKAIPSLSVMSSIFAGIGNSLISLTSNAAALLHNIGQIGGAALALPGIFTGMAIGLGTSYVAFKDISNQIPDLSSRLGDLQDRITGNFWDEALFGVTVFINNAFKDFSDGLALTSSYVGDFFGKFALSLASALDPSVINSMFGYLNESIRISTNSTDDFANIIRILGENGASYLPRLSQWFSDISSSFSNWLTSAEESGRLTEIIDLGIDRAKGLGNILLNTGKIIARVGKIAEESGAVSLNSMADALGRAADKINSEPFRSRLAAVFESAHDAMDSITTRAAPSFNSAIESLSEVVETTLNRMAPSIGDFFNGLFTGLDSGGFQSGFNDMISGISDGISGFSKNIPGIADGLGSLMSIIGALAEELLPLLGRWLDSIATVAQALEGPIIAVVKALGGLMEAITYVINPTTLLAGAAGGLIATLSGLYQPAFAASLIFEKIGTSALLGSTKLGKFSSLASNALLGLSTAGSQTAAAVSTGVSSAGTGIAGLATKLTGATGASRVLAAGLTAVPFVGLGIMALGAAKGVYDYSQKVRFAIVNTEQAATELTELGVNADITGTQLDKLLSTGWGPWRDEVSSSAEAFEKFGKTAAAAGDDYANDVKQLDEIISNMINAGDIDGARDLYEGFANSVRTSGGDVEQFAGDMELTNTALAEHGGSLDDTTDSLYDNAKAQQKANEELEFGTEAIRDQAGALSDYAAKVKESNDGLFTAHDNIRSVYDALDDMNEKFTSDGENAAEWIKPFESLKDVDLDSFYDSWVDLSTSGTEAQRDAGAALEDYVQTALEAISTAEEMGSSNEQLAGKYDTYRDKVMAMADAFGLSSDEMALLLDQMGLLGGTDALDRLENTTRRVFDGISYEVTKLSDGKWSIKIDGQTFDADEKVKNLGAEVEQLDGGKYSVTFNGETIVTTDPNITANEFFAQFEANLAGKTATVDAGVEKSSTFDSDAQTIVESVGAVPAEISVCPAESDTFDASVTMLRQAVGDTTAEMPVGATVLPAFYSSVDGASTYVDDTTGYVHINGLVLPEVGQKTAQTKSSIDNTEGKVKVGAQQTSSVQTEINSAVSKVNDSSGYLKVRASDGGVQSDVSTIVSKLPTFNVKMRATAFTVANGGILKEFAGGGIEKHVAQIARGTYRLWSEPETGGEVYVPLARAKRTRSQKIFQEAAPMLGMTTPEPISTYANGGVTGKSSIGTINAQNAPDVTVNVYNNGSDLNGKQVGRSISRNIAARLR